jgi:hypothetical protein
VTNTAPNVFGGPLDGAYRPGPIIFGSLQGVWVFYCTLRDSYEWRDGRWLHRQSTKALLDVLADKYQPLTPDSVLRKERRRGRR